jgi:L-ascorbate metabolism protein UlaG (beta-lactamase superfamily)
MRPVHTSIPPSARHFLKPGQDPENSSSVKALFLGTNSLLLSDGKTRLFVDPYFSRPGKLQTLFSKIRPNPRLVEKILRQAGVTRADAVLCTHSHFDHLLDAPMVAQKTHAVLSGSASTVMAGLGAGLPKDRCLSPRPGDPVAFGDFTVTFFPGKHLPFPWFLKPLAGIGQKIPAPLTTPAHFTKYKEGGCSCIYIQHPRGTCLVVGSANYIPGAFQGVAADELFLAAGGLDMAPASHLEALYSETVEAINPQRVLLTHWDDFSRPLSKPPRWIGKCSRTVDLLQEIKTRKNGPDFFLMPLFHQEALFRNS